METKATVVAKVINIPTETKVTNTSREAKVTMVT
jgi:hypothetical protein